MLAGTSWVEKAPQGKFDGSSRQQVGAGEQKGRLELGFFNVEVLGSRSGLKPHHRARA